MWGADGQVYFVSERDGFFTYGACRRPAAAPRHVVQEGRRAVSRSMSPTARPSRFENEFEYGRSTCRPAKPRKVVNRHRGRLEGETLPRCCVEEQADAF